MANNIYERIKKNMPVLLDGAISYRQLDDFIMIINYEDGTSILYDDFDRSRRRLPSDIDSMSEQECRDEFGERLRRLMYKKRISQEELSEKTGINRTLISRYFHGKTTPSFYNVDKICKALGCSADELRYVR